VSRKRVKNLVVFSALAALVGFALLMPAQASAADRAIKSKVTPVYPELARKMAVSGSVKVEVTIAPNGSVKNVKVIGGHPLLVDAAVDAVKRFKYETAPEETTQIVEFKFSPSE
jgi:TonB family protein